MIVTIRDTCLVVQGHIVKSLRGLKIDLPPQLSPQKQEEEEGGNHIRRPVAASRIYVQLPAHSQPGTQVRIPGPDGNSVRW
jgi:hypothetical protein